MIRNVRHILAVVLTILLVPIMSSSIPVIEKYEKAKSILDQNFDKETRSPIYTKDNIYNNLKIPSYDEEIQDYEGVIYREIPTEISEAIEVLVQCALEEDHLDSLVALGDIYMFGNFSIKADYKKAHDYYKKAVSVSGHGHAYFMLGFIYTTGMFGEFPIDEALGVLYYEFAVENGDTNALFALAYKELKGIGTPVNCELALFYYTRLANLGMKALQERDEEREEIGRFYNIRLPDFNGGLFGSPVSEIQSSIVESSPKDILGDEIDEYPYTNYYYEAMESYEGDYFTPRNYTKSFEILKECFDHGEQKFGKKGYKNMHATDQFFLVHCQAKLGHMYLKGLGVEKNYDEALKYLKISASVKKTAECLTDIGYMYEHALLPETSNKTKALTYYGRAIKLDSHQAKLNYAKIAIEKTQGKNVFQSAEKKQIYDLVYGSVYSGNAEALYYFGEFLQSGLAREVEPEKDISCENTIIFYRMFLVRMESFFLPQLKYAFNELRHGNYKNALLGYSIVAELGFDHAQVSTSFLLFQAKSLKEKKNAKYSKPRVEAAIKYLELSSTHQNTDATVMLGDLYYNGLGDVLPQDYDNAFAYYNKAESKHSAHASFNMALMYEYGLGPGNTVDYFMAKRYYDLSLKYGGKNKIPVNLALLKLRLKYIFSRQKNPNPENTGWLSAFKSIRTQSNQVSENNILTENRADAHHEGETFIEEEYDVIDYLVVIVTFVVFFFIFIRNLYQQLRRMRNPNLNNNNDQNPNINEPVVPGLNARVGNFQFQFFAL
ncbi:ERAD-associated E3 ubiquitin-protein ligase component Hrd3p [[Candida] anglica]|uniref:ERAD-associated E3 ubiquitin-protein ligase component Hrd3p n=1 Tax=[Candida] anglica TaxID=148631 RepID=A0ABP0EEJ8_9ASCO